MDIPLYQLTLWVSAMLVEDVENPDSLGTAWLSRMKCHNRHSLNLILNPHAHNKYAHTLLTQVASKWVNSKQHLREATEASK